jgi:hypothetical protein
MLSLWKQVKMVSFIHSISRHTFSLIFHVTLIGNSFDQLVEGYSQSPLGNYYEDDFQSISSSIHRVVYTLIFTGYTYDMSQLKLSNCVTD